MGTKNGQRYTLAVNGKRRLAILLFTLCLEISTFSQSNKLGQWLMGFTQLRVHDKWSIHAEVQYRDYGIFDEAEQLLLRTGLNYHINAQCAFSVGYGRVTSFPDDNERIQNPSVSENRFWQQFLVRHSTGRFFFEHRYRLEQRWINSNTTSRYLDRIRYLLRVTVPLNSKEMKKNTWFLSSYNEVFILFSNAPFDRNRLYGALGYQLTPLLNVQLGYMAQTVNITTKHYLQAAVFYNIDLRGKE